MTTILGRINSLATDLAEIATRTPAKHRHRIVQIADIIGAAQDFAHDGAAAQMILSKSAEDLDVVTPVTPPAQSLHRRTVQTEDQPPQPEGPPSRRRLPMDRLIVFMSTRARGATIKEVSQEMGVSYITASSKLKLAWLGGQLRRSGHPLRYYVVITKEPLPELPSK